MEGQGKEDPEDLKEQQMRRNDCSSCIFTNLRSFMLQETLRGESGLCHSVQ